VTAVEIRRGRSKLRQQLQHMLQRLEGAAMGGMRAEADRCAVAVLDTGRTDESDVRGSRMLLRIHSLVG